MTFERFTVVRVPFPFTDRLASKNRPALVLSDAEAFNTPTGHAVLAMITSAENPAWAGDCPNQHGDFPARGDGGDSLADGEHFEIVAAEQENRRAAGQGVKGLHSVNCLSTTRPGCMSSE